MFETLISNIMRVGSEFHFELGRAEDMYRLEHILKLHIEKLAALHDEAHQSVQELEATYE
jgi:hypothetical protein